MVTFQNSRWRPSAILDFRKSDFWPIDGIGLLIFHQGTKFGAKMLIDTQVMAKKRNSKWRPPPSWIYFRSLFLTYSRLSTFKLNHHTKFGANISIGGWLMWTFQNSRWRLSAILDFRKSDFWPIVGLGLLIFHHGTKFGAKCWSTPKLWPKNEIQNGGGRHLELIPVAIFDIQPTFYSWAQPPHKIWCQYLNWRLTYGNFSEFKMAAVRHLGIVVCSYKTTNEASVLGHISLSNFMSIRCIDLKIWGFNFFCRFGLKCLFTPPKFGFLGVKSGKISPWGKNDPLGN